MLILYARAVLAAGALSASLVAADARELDPNLKQYVISTCSTDAYRLCPTSLGSEHDAVACMRTKRAQLNHACRVAYDRVVRVLAQ